MSDLNALPDDLPVPVDDGAADHLAGASLPAITLDATSGERVALNRLGRAVLYFYPLTGRPGAELPAGWDSIPGARGCTTEACDFRDHHADLLAAAGRRLYSRLTLIVADGRVEHVFYPVFPPNEHARAVLAWLRADAP